MIENKLKSINPKNNSFLKSWLPFSKSKLDAIVKKAATTQSKWSNIRIESRLNFIKKLSVLICNEKNQLAELMANEMGKPISQGIAEIEKCSSLCDYYVKNSKNMLSINKIDSNYHKSYISYQPLGLVLGVMPWNFPFWQIFRFAVPSIIAGNGVLLKHAPNVQGCANMIEDCFLRASFPKYLFNNLQINQNNLSNVIANNNVACIVFTGSTKGGRVIAQHCANNLKKVVLELGGCDAFVILDDANIDKAVDACVRSRLLNGGQSCISAKRIIVTKKNIRQFSEKLLNELKNKVVGDPLEDVDMGPLVSIEAKKQVHDYVLGSIKLGAELITGGKLLSNNNSFYPITVLNNVKPGMPAFDEEIFGPVFSIIEAKDQGDAIKLANNNIYGLGCTIFTSDIKRAEKIAERGSSNWNVFY